MSTNINETKSEMKVDYCKVAAIGLKVLIGAVVGGTIIYSFTRKKRNKKVEAKEEEKPGNDEIDDNFPPLQPQQQEQEEEKSEESFSEKLGRTVKIGQATIAAISCLIGGIATISAACDSLFNKNYYQTTLLTSPSNGYWGSQVIPQSAMYNTDIGMNYNTPTSLGADSGGKGAYGIRRSVNIIDVY